MRDQLSIRRIVVGADPSPGATAALRWAGELAGRYDAELLVVHARGLLEAAAHTERVPAWLTDLASDLAPELTISVRVVDAPPPEALLHIAAVDDVDLLVVGKRGAGSPFELTMGSTSREVVSRAPVPVLVVPDA
jgi:nucleotide-binding universal stress UspA family protein